MNKRTEKDMSGYEYPKIEKSNSPVSETKETHPAYGMIGASRVTGNYCLFGSDFVHHALMTISISRAELNRGLSNDWPFAHDEIIEVALSEAQWATFVSTPNNGQGVQCTIQHIHRQNIPQIPEPPDRHSQFKQEQANRLNQLTKDLEEFKRMVEQINMPAKAKKDLLWKLHITTGNLAPNQQFTADQFTEHMEKVTEHAKIEVNAYLTNAVQRAGLHALGAKLPLTLAAPKEGDL